MLERQLVISKSSLYLTKTESRVFARLGSLANLDKIYIIFSSLSHYIR